MKEVTKEQWQMLSNLKGLDAIECIDTALAFLWADKTISLNDKIAQAPERNYDYEELLGTLQLAKEEIESLKTLNGYLQREIEELEN